MELRIEHRLTKLEEAVVGGTSATCALTDAVLKQNGRIGKLERFQAQILLIGALIVAAGPFIFFALDRVFPQ